jgi:two-component system, OmpR family, response regulator
MPKHLNHVLYVDDDAHIQEVAQMCLEMVGGYQVTCLNSGLQLIEKLGEIKPDLILLDVMMPAMDGPTALKALKQNNVLSNIPVIFMTARAQPEEIKNYIEQGAVNVIAKPFDPMILSEQINTIWKKYHNVID